jgi:HEPN domain-containing protein
MADDADKRHDHADQVIHLGTFDFSGKGPGTYSLGVAKLWPDPERDLLSEADSFRKAADRCLNGCKDEVGIEMLTVPGAVCAALSCELFLKYILLKEHCETTKGHKLDELFSKWSAEAQAALMNRRVDIRELFERNRDHFADARYHHERNQYSFRQQELLQTAELLSAFVHERYPDDTA